MLPLRCSMANNKACISQTSAFYGVSLACKRRILERWGNRNDLAGVGLLLARVQRFIHDVASRGGGRGIRTMANLHLLTHKLIRFHMCYC